MYIGIIQEAFINQIDFSILDLLLNIFCWTKIPIQMHWAKVRYAFYLNLLGKQDISLPQIKPKIEMRFRMGTQE